MTQEEIRARYGEIEAKRKALHDPFIAAMAKLAEENAALYAQCSHPRHRMQQHGVNFYAVRCLDCGYSTTGTFEKLSEKFSTINE